MLEYILKFKKLERRIRKFFERVEKECILLNGFDTDQIRIEVDGLMNFLQKRVVPDVFSESWR